MKPAPAGNFIRDLPKFDDSTAFKDHYKYTLMIISLLNIISVIGILVRAFSSDTTHDKLLTC